MGNTALFIYFPKGGALIQRQIQLSLAERRERLLRAAALGIGALDLVHIAPGATFRRTGLRAAPRRGHMDYLIGAGVERR